MSSTFMRPSSIHSKCNIYTLSFIIVIVIVIILPYGSYCTPLHSRTIDAEQIVIKSLSRVNKGHQVVKLVHKFEGNWQTLVDNLSSATLSKLQEVECSPRGSLPALSFIADNPQVMENLCFCNGIRIAIQYDLSVSSDKVSQFMVILWRVPGHASFTSS